MKKKLLFLIIILLLVGCSKEKTQDNVIEDKTTNTDNQEQTQLEETYIDNNPIKLGIYMYYNSNTNRKQLTEYTTSWNLNVDLCSLEIYFTDESEIPGTNQKILWNNYYNNYENIDSYRIGYYLEFETTDKGKIQQYILSPKDTNDIYGYMQIYLYDDIHQDGGWYSHITEEEYTDNNILTSIKLTGSTYTDNITSDITLTAFTYDEDDFDENNEYRGISKQTIIIKKA